MSKTNGSGPNGFNPFTAVAVADPDDVRIAALEQTVAELTARSTAIRAEIAEVAAENEELERSNAAIREYEQSEIDKQYWADHRRAKVKERKTPASSTDVLTELDTLELVTTTPQPLDWLADGVFARGYMTLFGGREKRGKSLVQLALGVAMASGITELAGIAIKPGKVLLVDAENGKREIHRRVRSLGLRAEHADNLVIEEARGFDLASDLWRLERLLERHRPDLLLLDSFRSLWRGDERDEAEIAAALYPVSALAHDRGMATSLTHHAKKSGEDYRGSTAIGAVPDWVVMLVREENDPVKARRRLSTLYARIAPERDDRWMTIASDGTDEGPVWLAEAEPYEREHEAPIRDEVVAEMVEVLRGGCQGGTPRGTPGNDALEPNAEEGCQGAASYVDGTPAPPAPTWTQADLIRAVGRDPKHRSGRDAVKHLIELGALYRTESGRFAASPTLFEEEEDE